MQMNKRGLLILSLYGVIYIGYLVQYGFPKTIQEMLYASLYTGLLGGGLTALCILTLSLFGFPICKILKIFKK